MMKAFDMLYNEFDEYCNELYDTLTEKKVKPDLIVGIARGGLIPAVRLSHMFDAPLETIKWQTRDGSVKENNKTVVNAIAQGLCVVFVDDINDTGTTFQQIKDHYDDGTNAVFVCVLEKKQSNFKCDYTGALTDTERWINFPWEGLR